MKDCWNSDAKITKVLYIPHGSDESYYDKFLLYFFLGFISHMVQMKDTIVINKSCHWQLYIPHGSDESL